MDGMNNAIIRFRASKQALLGMKKTIGTGVVGDNFLSPPHKKTGFSNAQVNESLVPLCLNLRYINFVFVISLSDFALH